MRRTSRYAGGDPSTRGVRRLALVQCSTCLAKASAVIAGGEVLAVNIPAVKKDTGWFHVPCKRGRFVAYDIGGARA